MGFFSPLNPSAVWSPFRAQGLLWQKVALFNQVFTAFISPSLASPGKAVMPPQSTWPQQLKAMGGWRGGEGVLWAERVGGPCWWEKELSKHNTHGWQWERGEWPTFPLRHPGFSRDMWLHCMAGWVWPADRAGCGATRSRADTVTNTPSTSLLRKTPRREAKRSWDSSAF